MLNIIQTAVLLLFLSLGVLAQKGGGGSHGGGGGGGNHGGGGGGNKGGGQPAHPPQQQHPQPKQPSHPQPPQVAQPHPPQQPRPGQGTPTQQPRPGQGSNPFQGNNPQPRPGQGVGNPPNNGGRPNDGGRPGGGYQPPGYNPGWSGDRGGPGGPGGPGGYGGWNNGGRDGGWRGGSPPQFVTVNGGGWDWNRPQYAPATLTSYVPAPTWDAPYYPIITYEGPNLPLPPTPGCSNVQTTQRTQTITEATYTSTITDAPDGMVTVYVDDQNQSYTYGASTIYEVYIYTTTQDIDIVGMGVQCPFKKRHARTAAPSPAMVMAQATPTAA